MTRDEILAMKPGRELDALVAEKVMGWVEFSPIDPTIDFGVHGKYRWNYAKDPKDGKKKPIPCYSEDIAAAWEVVQEMRKKGFDFAFETLNDSLKAGGDLYHARFFRKYEGDYGEFDSDISEADAICKAALLAVMDGEDEHERD